MPSLFRPFLLLCLLSLSLSSSAQNRLEELIEQQIARMSPEEKMRQLHRNTFWTTPDNNRLNIPGFTMSDGPHGVRFVDATCFPVGMGIAASWNRDLAHRVGAAMGREFHAYGKHQQLGPALDLCRDPRNGRSPETGGEDPFLCAHLNIELVKGIQESPVIATIKHFNGVNKQVNRHHVDHNISYRQLMEHYGYNFRRVMQDAGPLSVMNAYNKINGEKSAESPMLLTHILRERWGFPFYVVSDWGSVHHAEQALKAGCDLEMDVDESEYEVELPKLYASGNITDADLDRALRRVLRVKYLSGMMDNYPTANPFEVANSKAHQQLALKAGREAIVLLKNENNILPITNNKARIALIGPSAQVAQLDGFGSSKVDPPYAVSPLEGLQQKIPSDQIQVVKGCAINDSDTSGFAEARKAAASSDVVVFVGGLDATQEGENYEPGPVDRTGGSVDLPVIQQQLINELAKINPNVIVVLKSGGICAVPKSINQIKGFLYAFYPGMEGGNAIADVLFGDYNPSGKLPVTMPVSNDQMPEWNDDFSDDFNGGYRYYDERGLKPQFAFGHGLSYTTFAYSNMRISAASVSVGTPITMQVDVKNTGSVAGEEVAQLYLQRKAPDLWMPKKELKGFEKVSLEPGETKTVSFTLTANELYYFDEDADRYGIPLGNYVFYAGAASDQLTESISCTITPGQRLPDLAITRIYHHPRFPKAGEAVQFFALVKNQGTADLLPGNNPVIQFEVDGEVVSAHSTITKTIYAGGAQLVASTAGPNRPNLWTVPAGKKSFEIKATIDPAYQLPELIETNNVFESRLTLLPEKGPVNLCLNKPITSVRNSEKTKPEYVTDGSFNTSWSSRFPYYENLVIDLQGVYAINQIELAWGKPFSPAYELIVSADGVNWTTLGDHTNHQGNNHSFSTSVKAQYIRIKSITAEGELEYQLLEVQAYGERTSTDD